MGNPLRSEGAAFRWLIVILVGAASVALLSRIFGSIFAIWYGLVLIFILIGFIAKGMVYMLGSPDEDEPDEGEPDEDNDAIATGEPAESDVPSTPSQQEPPASV